MGHYRSTSHTDSRNERARWGLPRPRLLVRTASLRTPGHFVFVGFLGLVNVPDTDMNGNAQPTAVPSSWPTVTPHIRLQRALCISCPGRCNLRVMIALTEPRKLRPGARDCCRSWTANVRRPVPRRRFWRTRAALADRDIITGLELFECWTEGTGGKGWCGRGGAGEQLMQAGFVAFGRNGLD